jgi:hypothetical protein
MPPDEDPSLLDAVRVDLRRLHEAWLGVAFSGRAEAAHPVTGPWTPDPGAERVAFRAWSALGVLALAVAYPVAVLGLAVRFHVRRFDRFAELVGLVGVVVLTGLLWGALAVVARTRFSAEGDLAVVAAAVVATVAAGLAVVFSRVGGRVTSVLLAWPFGVTAVFLPPVVAALYSPALAGYVFPHSTSLAAWLLDNVLSVAGLATTVREQFDLVGLAYVGMWFGLAVPVGWLLGSLVALADVVRPTDDAADEGSDGE